MAKKKRTHLSDQQIIKGAGIWAYAIGLVVAAGLYLAELLITKNENYAVLAVWMAMEAALNWYKYAKGKKTGHVILGILFTLLAVAFIVLHILKLLGIK